MATEPRWRDAAIQAKDDLRAIEEAFQKATPVGEDGPNPPIGPGHVFAEWTSPALTMRWIEEMEAAGREAQQEPEGNGLGPHSSDVDCPTYYNGCHCPQEPEHEFDRQQVERRCAVCSCLWAHIDRLRAHVSQEPKGEEVYLHDLPEWPTRTEVINEATVARDTVVPVDVAGIAYEYIGKVRARVQPRRVSREEYDRAVLAAEITIGHGGPAEAVVRTALSQLGFTITPTEGDDRG